MSEPIGYATLQVIPSMKGVGAALGAQVAGPAAAAGKTGGAAMGAAMKKGLLVGAAALGAIGVGLFKVGEEFDSAVDTIRIGTGATGKALEGLKGDFKGVVGTVPADMADVSTSIADINTRLGLTGKPLQERSRQFLELSRITGTDLSSNIKNVTRVFGDWGVGVEQQGPKMDALFRASQATGATVDELAGGMVRFGAPMRQLGFDFNTTAGLLGKFEKEGVNTNLVMGSMRIALGKMAKEGEPAQETLERVTGQIKNAGSASEANKLALELFGARAGPDMAAAIREGRFELGDLHDQIANGKETIMGAGKDTMDFSEQWMMFKENIKKFVEPAASALFSAITRGMEWLNTTGLPALQRFGEFLSRNATTIKVVAAAITAFLLPSLIKAGVEAIKSAVLQVRAWIMARVEAIKGAVQAGVAVARVVTGWVIMGAQSLLGAAKVALAWIIAMGPIALVIAAVVGLVVLIVKNWSKILAFTKKIWSAVTKWVSDKARAAKEWVVRQFTALRDRAVSTFTSLRDRVVAAASAVRDRVVGLFTALRDRAVAIAAALRDRVVGFFGAIRDRLAAVGATIRERVVNAFVRLKDGAIRVAGNLVSWITGLPGRIVRGLGNLGSLLYNAGRDVLVGLWNGLASMGSWIKSKIIGLVSNILPGPVKKILGIASPSKLFMGFGEETGKGLALGLMGTSRLVTAAAADLASAASLGASSQLSSLRPKAFTPPAAIVPDFGDSSAARAGGRPVLVEGVFQIDGATIVRKITPGVIKESERINTGLS